MQAGRVSTHRKLKVTKTMRDRIVLEHLPLVKAIAVRVHENLPVHVDVDDLFHAGVLGLFDAAVKYNPDKKVVFSAYAKHRIKGAILDSLRQLDWASRDQRKRQKQLESATRELTSKLGRLPTEAEVAGSMGYDAERWRRVAMEMRMVGVFSSSVLPGEQNNGLQPEFPARPDSQPDMMCEREQLRHTLARGTNAAGALSEGGSPVLHERDDHEGDRRYPGCQRKPRLADPQERAGEDGGRAAVGRNQLGAGFLIRLTSCNAARLRWQRWRPAGRRSI
jgi:RNA polymerase sigma factor (sigma-70 family)